MKTFSFEKLTVWEKSISLASHIYKVTSTYPKEEKFGLISQMRRCAVSISSNIAEGSGRHGKRDKARFTEISFGSSLELLNQAILSKELGFIGVDELKKIRTQISEITLMLDALYKSQFK